MNTNKQPLYKQLNEQRTQGELNIVHGVNLMTKGKFRKRVCSFFNDDKQMLAADIEYTALAVNNLEFIADISAALHRAVMELEIGTNILEWWQKHKNTVANAKEALLKIS